MRHLRLVLLFLPEGAFWGFLLAVAPYFLRDAGASSAASASVGYLSLPIAFAFLWAPWMDRPFPGLRTTRRSWLWITQASALLMLGLAWLALSVQTAVAWVVAALLGAALAYASRGLVLNAWIKEAVPDPQQGMAVATRLVGMLAGQWIGGGWLAEHFELLSWAGTLGVMVGLLCLSTLGLWGLSEPQRIDVRLAALPLVAVLKHIGSRPLLRRSALAMALISAVLGPPMVLGAVFLNDAGLQPRDMAWANGYVGATVSAVGALLIGWLCQRLPPLRVLVVLLGLQVVLALIWVLAAADLIVQPWMLVSLMAAQLVNYVMITTVMMVLMMARASRATAGTDIALMNGVVYLVAVLGQHGAGFIADGLADWRLFFAGVTLLCGITLVVAPGWLLPSPRDGSADREE